MERDKLRKELAGFQARLEQGTGNGESLGSRIFQGGKGDLLLDPRE